MYAYNCLHVVFMNKVIFEQAVVDRVPDLVHVFCLHETSQPPSMSCMNSFFLSSFAHACGLMHI